jgi:hypothetical protein
MASPAWHQLCSPPSSSLLPLGAPLTTHSGHYERFAGSHCRAAWLRGPTARRAASCCCGARRRRRMPHRRLAQPPAPAVHDVCGSPPKLDLCILVVSLFPIARGSCISCYCIVAPCLWQMPGSPPPRLSRSPASVAKRTYIASIRKHPHVQLPSAAPWWLATHLRRRPAAVTVSVKLLQLAGAAACALPLPLPAGRRRPVVGVHRPHLHTNFQFRVLVIGSLVL